MGTIRKTKSGNFQADVRDKQGRRYRKVFRNRKEASKYIAMTEDEKYTLKLAKVGLKSIPTPLPALIDQAIKCKGALAPASYTKYKSMFEFFRNFVDNERINFAADFTRVHADKYRDIIINTKASAKTKNFYLSTIKSLFKDLVDRDLILKNPFSHIKMERKKNKTMLEREEEYYTETEIKSFFAVNMDIIYKKIFLGMFLTGMRREELLSLKWHRVSFVKRMIEIRTDGSFTTKTESSERDVPMSNYLFTMLTEMNNTKNSEYVFPSSRNTKMDEDKLLRVCKDIAKEAGISKNATLHKWRHSFSSHLEQLGVSESVRGYLMGHKPKTMTGHYTKIDPTKLYEQVSKLDQLINERTKE
ncbi:MAG: tyrosine-type recombinase/integrase [Ignavibacteriales bacterium]|nr:tyrosine-type recombinase/integrase [Ignavibacteriales bacterium]